MGKAGELILGKKVNNYTEYKKRLKEFFQGINEMPSNEEVQSFIDEYNLLVDWQIIILDVKKDISSLMLKNITGKSKFISSYKQYLVQLKKSFGIPNEMPSRRQIKEFIKEYNLEKSWGIVEEDIVKDLEEIINGKYDDMLKDSAYVHDILEKKTVPKSPVNPYAPSVNRSTQKIAFQLNSLSNIDYGRPYRYTKYSSSVSEEISNIPKEEKRKDSNKINETKNNSKTQREDTIFIDGDNHIKEAQKGIEHTTKDIKVRAIFSQPGAKQKFDMRYKNRSNVSSKLVSPGDQAVDNQIKAEAGQLLRKGNQNVTFVSHDKGFDEYKNRKNDRSSGNRINTVKSVKDALK